MSMFFQRSALLLLIVVLQRSFLDVLWPTLAAPSLLLSLAVSLVFLLGFARGLGWTLITLLFYSVLGEVSYFPVFAVGVAYGTSFLSRRLLIERRVESGLALAAMALGSSLLYLLILVLVVGEPIGIVTWLANGIETVAAFPLVLYVMYLFEGRARERARSEFRDLRS